MITKLLATVPWAITVIGVLILAAGISIVAGHTIVGMLAKRWPAEPDDGTVHLAHEEGDKSDAESMHY